MKLDVGRFALSAAILWGAGIFLLGIIGHYGWGTRVVDVLGSGYIGYSAAVIGGIWGFFDALIGGALFACIYNWLGRHATA